jgi:hypothetical protein
MSKRAFFEYRAKLITPMIFTLILENERRDSLLYLRVVTVFKLLRLVGQAVEIGPWTHIEISKR